MNQRLDVPLFPNSDLDVHCVQATLQMILKYYFPERDYSVAYLDRITHHQQGGWTWDTSVFSFLINLGFEVVYIDDFSIRDYGERGADYLKTIWPKEKVEEQSLNADLDFERRLAQDFMTGTKRFVQDCRKGGTDDVKNLFHQGYVVVPNINAYTLDDEEGFCGHYVVVTSIGEEAISFNDSGLPAIKDRQTSWMKFEQARMYNPALFAVRK